MPHQSFDENQCRPIDCILTAFSVTVNYHLHCKRCEQSKSTKYSWESLGCRTLTDTHTLLSFDNLQSLSRLLGSKRYLGLMQVGLVTHPECSRHTAALPPKHFWSFLETNPRIWFDPWEPGCAIITRGSSTAGMKHAWVTFAVPSRSSLCFTVLYTDSVVIIMVQQLFLNPRYFGLRIFVFAQRGSLLHASMVLYLARHAQTRGALQVLAVGTYY